MEVCEHIHSLIIILPRTILTTEILKPVPSYSLVHLQFNQSPGFNTQHKGQGAISAVMSHPLSPLCTLRSDHQRREVKLLLTLQRRSARGGRKCRAERDGGVRVRKHLTKPDAFTVIQSTRPRKQHAPANVKKHNDTTGLYKQPRHFPGNS